MNTGRPSLAVRRACNCSTWGLLDSAGRDMVLADFVDWAWIFRQVQLKLMRRSEHIAVCELQSLRPSEGRASAVMNELGLWADCARVTLELSPSSHWGANVDRLTEFYKTLGFEPNQELEQPFRAKESMIRYPLRGKGHASGH